MTLALKPVWGGLVRLGLVLAVGAFLGSILGLIYPVQRELDLARYERASYRFEVEGVFLQPSADAVTAALGPGTCLVSKWVTSLKSTNAEVGPTELDATAPSCPADSSRFPRQTLIDGGVTRSRSWIDVNADAARSLGVGVGDEVQVTVAPDLPAVPLTVRGIYALRSSDAAAAAMAPAEVLFEHLPAGAVPGYGIALTRSAPADFLPRLAASPLRQQLEAAKGYPPVVSSVASRLRSAADASGNTLGLVRTVGALAVLGVVVLSLRELDVFRRRSLEVARLVHILGGSARSLLALSLGLSGVVAVAALSVGMLLAETAYAHGIIASCLPPTLAPSPFVVWGVVVSLTILLLATMSVRSSARVGRP